MNQTNETNHEQHLTNRLTTFLMDDPIMQEHLHAMTLEWLGVEWPADKVTLGGDEADMVSANMAGLYCIPEDDDRYDQYWTTYALYTQMVVSKVMAGQVTHMDRRQSTKFGIR